MATQILGHPLYLIICYFLFYSMVGFTIECIFRSIRNKKFVYAGFLYGPYCPIYGFAAVALILFLAPVQGSLLLFIVLAAVITTVFEYITGVILEKFLHVRLWDYSHQRFNYKGRVSLKFSICWVVLALIFMYGVYPFFNDILFNAGSPTVMTMVAYGILILLGIDVIASIAKGFSLRKAMDKLNELRADLKEKSEKLREDMTHNVALTEEAFQLKVRQTLDKYKRFLVFNTRRPKSKKYPETIKCLEDECNKKGQ